jgi:YfiR/HmsC-like
MWSATALSLRNGQSRRRVLGVLTAGLAVVTLVLTASGAVAQSGNQTAGTKIGTPAEQPSREYLIKAAILYNFAKFTRWPAESFQSVDAPLQLCVFGIDPFGEALAIIDGKRVGTRTLRTRLITDTAQVAECHLLFVSASESESLGRVLAVTDGFAILTVADVADFSKAGGIITLKVVEDRTRFDVNQRAADRAGLKLSAKLLRLADNVIQE